MYDSHAHLTIEPLLTNLDVVLDRFKKAGGEYILNVSYDPESAVQVISQYHKYSSKYPGMIRAGLGLHPEYFSELAGDKFSIYEKSRKAVDMISQIIEENRQLLSAIGETGLDYFHIFKDSSIGLDRREEIIEAQKLSFKKHLELAADLNLPLSIHTRDLPGETVCVEQTLNIVSEVGKGKLKGSFHSYTGSEKHLEEILDLGFHIGVNGIVTYPSASNVRELVKLIPNDRILIETDCPLLPPQSIRQDKKAEVRYGQPSDVGEILRFIAELKQVPQEEMQKITDDNFRKLFLRD
jgi:TatD DNase family protein